MDLRDSGKGSGESGPGIVTPPRHAHWPEGHSVPRPVSCTIPCDSLVDYGRRYCAGQPISTAFVESAVNQLIDKQMSKSQQMRWSPREAHRLLQVRAEVVDGLLGDTFQRWYPGFRCPEPMLEAA